GFTMWNETKGNNARKAEFSKQGHLLRQIQSSLTLDVYGENLLHLLKSWRLQITERIEILNGIITTVIDACGKALLHCTRHKDYTLCYGFFLFFGYQPTLLLCW